MTSNQRADEVGRGSGHRRLRRAEAIGAVVRFGARGCGQEAGAQEVDAQKEEPHMIYVLALNDMRASQIEVVLPRAWSSSREDLERFMVNERVESYIDADGDQRVVQVVSEGGSARVVQPASGRPVAYGFSRRGYSPHTCGRDRRCTDVSGGARHSARRHSAHRRLRRQQNRSTAELTFATFPTEPDLLPALSPPTVPLRLGAVGFFFVHSYYPCVACHVSLVLAYRSNSPPQSNQLAGV